MLAKLHRSDLWMIAADEDAVTAYRELTGVPLDRDALTAYRLLWALRDVAGLAHFARGGGPIPRSRRGVWPPRGTGCARGR